MRGCGLAEKVHPALAITSGLIPQQREDALVFEDALDIRAASFFGQHVLTRTATEIVYESVEEAVIECAGDSVSRKSKQAHQIAAELEVAEVAGNEDEWPAAKERADELFLVDDVRMLAPVSLVNLAWRLRDFRNHQDEVPPHFPGDSVAFFGGHAGKGDPQVLVDDVAAKTQDAGEEGGKDFGAPLARWQRQCLNGRNQHADDEVDHEINCCAPHSGAIFAQRNRFVEYRFMRLPAIFRAWPRLVLQIDD